MAKVVPIRKRAAPGQPRKARPTRRARPARPLFVHQFLIVLAGSDPLVWRRIQVPADYNFWELHVAIQDAMGWLDYHLHEFRLPDPTGQGMVNIGIPTDDDSPDHPVVPGWTVPLAPFFDLRHGRGTVATYAYDFGDDWHHVVLHKGFEPIRKGATYPVCVAGAGRCPPEDCGGISGYEELLRVLADRSDEEHAAMLEWTGGPIDPAAFTPAAVTFDDPMERWQKAFGRQTDGEV